METPGYASDQPQNSTTGEVEWSHLFRPDYQYNKKDGVYSLGLKMIGETKDPILEIIRESAGLKAKAENCPDYAKPPLLIDEETGNYTFKFKQNAVIHMKGEDPIEMKIDVYDAKMNPWPRDVEIGKGSMVKVRYRANSWNSSEQGGIGVTLRLIAVQVINHVPYVPSHGFEKEEGVDMTDMEFPPDSAGSPGDIPLGDPPATQQSDNPSDQHTGGPVVDGVPF